MSDIPIYKVGAVLCCGARVLLVRPLPKTPGEVPPFVLPRGSRQYLDSSGQWQDARDAATAQQFAATLEPFTRTLAREAEEEAGITPAQLAQAEVTELGAMAFQSRSKGTYPVYWFRVGISDALRAALAKPVDASEARWMTLEEIRALDAAGDFSAGYWPVIVRAMENI